MNEMDARMMIRGALLACLIPILNFAAFRGQETSCTARRDCYFNGSPHFKEYPIDGIDRLEKDSNRDVTSAREIGIRENKQEIEDVKNNLGAMKEEFRGIVAAQERDTGENKQDIQRLEEQFQVVKELNYDAVWNNTAALENMERTCLRGIENLTNVWQVTEEHNLGRMRNISAAFERKLTEQGREIESLKRGLQVTEDFNREVISNLSAALESEARGNKLRIERLEERIQSLMSNSVELGARLGAIRLNNNNGWFSEIGISMLHRLGSLYIILHLFRV